MSTLALRCGSCDTPLPSEAMNVDTLVPCPRCGAGGRAIVFSALLRPLEAGSSGERIVLDKESSCFYHPSKKAVVPCDSCGRFLCALCDVEMNDQHLCPACLDAGKSKGKMEHLENQRTRYDAIAFTLAVMGLVPVCWYFIIFTAPAAVFMSIRYWNTPLSPVRTSRWRFVFAFILGVLQLSGMGLVIALIVMEAMRA